MSDIDIEKTAKIIVNSAIQVHRALGPGLLESAYQQCIAHEIKKRGATVKMEILLPILYDGIKIEPGYRLDMLVNECVLVENKTVDQISPIHKAQILTYMRLGGFKLGFLLNWKVKLMKDGIKRMII